MNKGRRCVRAHDEGGTHDRVFVGLVSRYAESRRRNGFAGHLDDVRAKAGQQAPLVQSPRRIGRTTDQRQDGAADRFGQVRPLRDDSLQIGVFRNVGGVGRSGSRAGDRPISSPSKPPKSSGSWQKRESCGRPANTSFRADSVCRWLSLLIEPPAKLMEAALEGPSRLEDWWADKGMDASQSQENAG
jgi:hypothetical protein